MSWIDDIIESLPRELEELARTYLPVIKRMAREETALWIECMRVNDEIAAHALLVQRMNNEEIAADGDRGNEIIKELNKGNAEKVNLGWHILRMIITIGLDKIHE